MVPVLAWNWLLFTGGEVMPLLKVTDMLVLEVWNPSRITAETPNVLAPSTHFVVGSVKV